MVRMGRVPKGWSKRSKELKQDKRLSKYEKDPLKNVATFQVGRVNPNMISTVYSSILLDLARQSSERYASHLVYFEHEHDKENQDTKEVEMDVNGEVKEEEALNKTKTQDDEIDWSHIDPGYNKQFHVFAHESAILEFLNQVLTGTSMDFSTVTNTYKARANVVKFERLLDEKYGFARPFLTHPKVEPYVKLAQRKWATGKISFTRQGEPPLGKTASIVLLFMMYRNGIRKDAVALAALYLLVGLQPWVLLISALVVCDLVERKKKKTIPGMRSPTIPQISSYYSENLDNRNEFLKFPVGTPFSPGEEKTLGEKYNSIILGDGPNALYCAALLSRTGRKVLVLTSSTDASGEVTLNDTFALDTNYNLTKSSSTELIDSIQKADKGKVSWEDDIPFTVTDAKIGHTQRNQNLLAPALATDTDCQGGIRFATIGSEADGYAHSIFTIPGMGTGNASAGSSDNPSYSDDSPPFVLRAGGVHALAEDTAMFLGDAWQLSPDDITSSVAANYSKIVGEMNVDAGPFFLSKLTDSGYNTWWDSKSKNNKNEYRTASVRYASDFLSHYIPLNPHVRSLCAGIGMHMEDLPPSKCSMAAHVTNISSFLSPGGFTFPVGGVRAFGKALENVIVKNGGRVVTGVQVKDLVFDKAEEEKIKNKNSKDEKTDQMKVSEVGPKCLGVSLSNGTVIRVASLSSSFTNSSKKDIEGSVISTNGFLDTFLRLTPENVRTLAGVPPGLPALNERRPQLKLLLLLKGDREKLNIPSADWWRLPNASLPRDEHNADTNQVTPGIIGEMSSAMEQDENYSSKFSSGSSWMRVSFPSCKDPSWEDRYKNRHTCVVTIEADDDFVQMFDTKPKVYVFKTVAADVKKRLVARILKDVFVQFPQLEGNIMKLGLSRPIRMGLSHTPERYAATGMRPQTKYPNLYIAGSDLTLDTFSGGIIGSWLAANAVVGYDYLSLGMLGKTLTSDLKQFMEGSDLDYKDGEEAILYTPKTIIVEKELELEEDLLIQEDVTLKNDSEHEAPAEASKES